MADVKIPIEFVAQFDKALAGLSDFAKQTETQVGNIENKFSSFGSIVGFNAFLGVTEKIVGGIREMAGALGEAVTEAAAAEQALNGVANALKASGDYSEQNVEAFKSLADQLSQVTKFTDDQILSQVALAKQFNTTNEQAAKLIRAATELASATGEDLGTAVSQLGTTLEGMPGRIGRVIPSIHNLTEEQLKAGAAIDIVAQRFKGFAEGELDTFNGRLGEAKKAFTEFMKAFGETIVNNDSVKFLFQAITQGLKDLTAFVVANSQTIKSFISTGLLILIEGFTLLAKTIEIVNDVLYTDIKLFESAGDLFSAIKNGSIDGIKDAFIGAKDAIVNLGKAVVSGEGLGTFGKVLDGVEKRSDSLADSIANVVVQQQAVVVASKEIKKSFDDQVAKIPVSLKELLDALKLGFEKPFGDNTGFLVPLTKSLKSALADAAEFFGISLGKSIKETDIAKALGRGGSIATDILGGSAGASKLLGKAGDSFLPGIGPLVEQLAKGPDQVKAMVDEFAKALPDLIAALIEAIPAFIEAIIEDVPLIIERLIDHMPEIIQAFIRGIPKIIEALVVLMPRVVGALVSGAAEFVGKIGEGAAQFVGKILEGAAQFVEKIVDGATGGLFSGDTGFGLGGHKGLLGGGVLPGILQQVAAGAQISPSPTVIGQRHYSGPQSIEVPVHIGNSQFARAIIDVKRLGYRLEPI